MSRTNFLEYVRNGGTGPLVLLQIGASAGSVLPSKRFTLTYIATTKLSYFF